jgi:O-antigen ligase
MIQSKSTYSAIKPNQLAFMDGLSLLAGGFSAFYVQIVGQLYLAEFIFPVLLLLFLRRKWGMLRAWPVRAILILGGLWLINLVITDIYLSTSQQDAFRGWALISVFLLDFIALHFLIYPFIKRIWLFGFGLALGLLLQTVLQPSQYISAEPWKFGYGFPVILLVILVGVLALGNRFMKSFLGVFVLFLFGIYLIFVGTRALGGIAIVSAVVVWFRSTRLGTSIARSLNPLTVFWLFLFLVVLFFAVLQVYAYSAERGLLGDSAKSKYEMQSGGGTLGMVLAARAELIPAIRAIGDSPWLGYGSWARDPNAQYREYLVYMVDWGYLNISPDYLRYMILSSDLLPTHSHLLQAWAWAGIAGMIFWVAILILVLKAIISAFRQTNIIFPLIVFLGLFAIWDIFFSPFGAIMRAKWAFSLNVMLYALMKRH